MRQGSLLFVKVFNGEFIFQKTVKNRQNEKCKDVNIIMKSPHFELKKKKKTFKQCYAIIITSDIAQQTFGNIMQMKIKSIFLSERFFSFKNHEIKKKVI